ncbi:MAG: hypothetical protein ACFB11_00610 [Paracoccaceae bacterium]
MRKWYENTVIALTRKRPKLMVFLLEYGVLTVAVTLFSICAVLYLLHFRVSPHVSAGYERAEVIGMLPLPDDTGKQRVVLDLQLASGDAIRLIGRARAATGIVDMACLERRAYTERDGSLLFDTLYCSSRKSPVDGGRRRTKAL